MSAFATGTWARCSISASASSEPIVSHFRMTPFVCVSTKTDFISDLICRACLDASSSLEAT